MSAYVRLPCGILRIRGTQQKVNAVEFVSRPGKDSPDRPSVIKKYALQLDEFFTGKRSRFSLPISMAGTVFQKRVWFELLKIPYGKTATYGQIAGAIGKPRAVRAVAAAISANPLCVVVPCHRVIGGDGSLTGYAYGLRKKAHLLRLEGALLN